MLYIGSCRYMYNYKWDSFPARLHTTKEIIYFLENIDNIQNIVNSTSVDLIDIIFGDICNPCLLNETTKFINKYGNMDRNKDIQKLVLEISSRKIFYYGNIPTNYYYTNYYINNRKKIDLKSKYQLTEYIISDEEIYTDLDYISKLAKTIFSNNIQIHIIPHLNLKCVKTKEYIFE